MLIGGFGFHYLSASYRIALVPNIYFRQTTIYFATRNLSSNGQLQEKKTITTEANILLFANIFVRRRVMKLKNTSQKYKLETDENAENSTHWIVIYGIPLVELFFKETSLREPAVIETF